MKGLFCHVLHIRYKNNEKYDPKLQADVIFIPLQQLGEEIGTLECENNDQLHVLGHFKYPSKVSMKLQLHQVSGDFDLSIQGCKTSKVETGEGTSLTRTGGLEA